MGLLDFGNLKEEFWEAETQFPEQVTLMLGSLREHMRLALRILVVWQKLKTGTNDYCNQPLQTSESPLLEQHEQEQKS